MNDSIRVTMSATGDGFTMYLKTGIITVPDKKGCYIVSTGCGSGKSTCSWSLIEQRADEGVLYCVDTIDAQKNMYNALMGNSYNNCLTEDDIIMLNCDESNRCTLYQYRDNPEILMSKKVVIITHARFWTDLINYFLIYKPQQPVDAFDGDFKTLMARNDLRKYIIFDETPQMIKPFAKISWPAFVAFINPDGSCKSRNEIFDIWQNWLRDTPDDPFPRQNCKINMIKASVIIDMIPKYFEQWKSQKGQELSIVYTPADLQQDVINTHVVIMEGAGDLLFQGADRYELLDCTNKKYNSPVNFEKFSFSLKRRTNISDEEMSGFCGALANKLYENKCLGKKTLVVVWKTSGFNSDTEHGDDFYGGVCRNLTGYGLNPYLYHVTYFGAADSKSTNEYRDYEEIILCGTWHITNQDTSKFNIHYGINTSNRNHLLWSYVQLLTRIGIRMYDASKTFTVWYSEDYETDLPQFIDQLGQYFADTTTELDTYVCKKTNSKYPDWLQRRFEKSSIRQNYHEAIWNLCQNNQVITDTLRSGHNVSVGLPLKMLYEIVPMKQARSRAYDGLIGALRSLGIDLVII